MNIHNNARLTPRGREILISRLKRGERPHDVATAMGVSASTVYKWRRGEAVTLDNIAKAAHVLEVHPAALLGATRVHADFVSLWKRRSIKRHASGRAA